MQKAKFDVENKILIGPKVHPIYNPNQNLGHLILNILRQTPDLITQISADTGISLNCGQMYERSIKIAKFLKKSGAKEGDVVGFVAANTENLAAIVFACFTLGLPINPLSPIMNKNDIIQMFSSTQPKIIFCDANNLTVVQNAVDEMKRGVKIFTVSEKADGYECVTDILEEMGGQNVDDFEFPSIDSNSIAAILCSSGSTGFPKGIRKSHKQIISGIQLYWEKSRLKSLRILQCSSIYWISGTNILIFSVLLRATRVTTSQPFDPLLTAEIIHKYKITDVLTPPFAFVELLKKKDLKPFDSIEMWLVGGMIVSECLCENFKKFIPNGMIVNVYACTEEGLLTLNLTGKNYGSVGMAINNVEMKIIDDIGNSLNAKEIGEICCKIPVHFSGYFGDPKETSEAFQDDWFKTSDIGYFDVDGHLYILDRKKDLMKYFNYQITSSEIELIINEIDGVISSCVVGIPEEGETGNDIIHSFVIIDKSHDLNENFILNYVNDKVIDPKRIRGGVHIVDSFPLGLTDKVDRKKVKEMALEMYGK